MRRSLGKTIIGASALILIVLFTMVAPAELQIGTGVRSFSQTAQAQFPGKRVEALMAMVDCESCSLQDRMMLFGHWASLMMSALFRS